MKTTFLGEGLIAGDSRNNWDWDISRAQNRNSTCRFSQEVGEKKNAGGHDKIGHISGALQRSRHWPVEYEIDAVGVALLTF